MQQVNYDTDVSTGINIGWFFVLGVRGYVVLGGSNFFPLIFDPQDILQRIQGNPDKYSEYLKELAKPYLPLDEKEGNHEYQKLRYNATGQMQGIYGYKVDSKKNSTSLGNPFPTKTITETKTDTITTTEPITKSIPTTETFTQTQTVTVTPTNQANHLAINKYSSAGLAFLTGLLFV